MSQDNEAHRTSTKTLMNLLENFNGTCFIAEDGECYVSIDIKGHLEVYHLYSSTFKRLLAGLYFKKHAKGIGDGAWAEFTNMLNGAALACSQTPNHKISVRVGGTREEILFDLCDEDWKVISINNQQWSVMTQECPIFRRTQSMLSVPEPHREGARLDLLWEILNLDDLDSRKLLEAWLITTLLPDVHVPMLVLNGEHGSSKSTATRLIRNLIDPNRSSLRSLPSTEKDLFIASKNSHILAYDNVSSISKDMSDALCRLITGGAYASRALYTDSDESVIVGHSTIVLNGITDFITRPDLLDRAVIVNLSAIPPHKRKPERVFEQKFIEQHPKILGALFDRLVEVLRLLPAMENVDNQDLPRMADYALVGIALEKINNWGEGSFMQTYNQNSNSAVAVALEGDPVADALVWLMKNRQTWTGTISDLMEICIEAPGNKGVGWPKSSHAYGRALARLTPPLRSKGLLVERIRSSSERVIMITKTNT